MHKTLARVYSENDIEVERKDGPSQKLLAVWLNFCVRASHQLRNRLTNVNDKKF